MSNRAYSHMSEINQYCVYLVVYIHIQPEFWNCSTVVWMKLQKQMKGKVLCFCWKIAGQKHPSFSKSGCFLIFSESSQSRNCKRYCMVYKPGCYLFYGIDCLGLLYISSGWILQALKVPRSSSVFLQTFFSEPQLNRNPFIGKGGLLNFRFTRI